MVNPMSPSWGTPGQLHSKGSDAYTFLVAVVAAIGGFLFGYDLVIISGANLLFEKQFNLTSAALGFATSSAILGCMVGPLIGGWVCDRIGRKNTLFITGFLFAIGSIGTAFPRTDTSTHFLIDFSIFRIVGGVGVGLASLAVPMYLAEISPTRIRGRLMIMYQLAIVIGAAAATLVSYYLALTLDPTVSWRWMCASAVGPVVVFMALLFFVPKSPRWLMKVGREAEALRVLARINGEQAARVVLKEIGDSFKEESGGYGELFQPGVRKAFAVGVMLALFNNWTGWSSIAYYQPRVYQQAGIDVANPATAIRLSFFILMVHLLLTIVSIATIDKVGRRALWNISSAMMVVAMGVVGALFHFHISGHAVFFAMILVAIPHALGLGPLPWVMMSEIFPNRIRSKAVASTTLVLWIGSWAGAQSFPMMIALSEKHFGTAAAAFWVFSVISVLSLIFGLRVLIETKGRSLEEIARHWLHDGKTSSSHSEPPRAS